MLTLPDGLTPGERLFLWRKRKGMSQDLAAEVAGVTRRQWGPQERDQRPVKFDPKLDPKLAQHEICLLLRRRAGIDQKDVARALGYSRYWVALMEQGDVPCEPLIEYWEGRNGQ